MNWPSTLVVYHRSDTFTRETLPESLTQEHDLEEGVWALIRILEGELVFMDLENGREAILSPQAPGFVEPGQKHCIEARDPVRFYIEFYRDANDASEATDGDV